MLRTGTVTSLLIPPPCCQDTVPAFTEAEWVAYSKPAPSMPCGTSEASKPLRSSCLSAWSLGLMWDALLKVHPLRQSCSYKTKCLFSWETPEHSD